MLDISKMLYTMLDISNMLFTWAKNDNIYDKTEQQEIWETPIHPRSKKKCKKRHIQETVLCLFTLH